MHGRFAAAFRSRFGAFCSRFWGTFRSRLGHNRGWSNVLQHYDREKDWIKFIAKEYNLRQVHKNLRTTLIDP